MDFRPVRQSQLFNVNLLGNMNASIPVIAMSAAIPVITKNAAFDVLTQPSLDQLRFVDQDNQNLAKSVLGALTDDNLNHLDCSEIKKLFRRVMMMVHPDKVQDSSFAALAHQAAVNLNNAREALGCR